MAKILLFTLLGIVLLIGGVFLAYFGFLGINDGQGWLLIPSLLVVAGSSYLLFRTGKSEKTVVHKSKLNLEKLSVDDSGFESTIEKNNAAEAEFGKTNDARNRLKILQAAGDAGKK